MKRLHTRTLQTHIEHWKERQHKHRVSLVKINILVHHAPMEKMQAFTTRSEC